MEKLNDKTVAIFLLMLTWNIALIAQTNPDSIRIVHQAI